MVISVVLIGLIQVEERIVIANLVKSLFGKTNLHFRLTKQKGLLQLMRASY